MYLSYLGNGLCDIAITLFRPSWIGDVAFRRCSRQDISRDLDVIVFLSGRELQKTIIGILGQRLACQRFGIAIAVFIGGIHIVNGTVAHEGYLDNTCLTVLCTGEGVVCLKTYFFEFDDADILVVRLGRTSLIPQRSLHTEGISLAGKSGRKVPVQFCIAVILAVTGGMMLLDTSSIDITQRFPVGIIGQPQQRLVRQRVLVI